MTRKILITLNIIAVLGSIYWLIKENQPEPFTAVVLSIANLVGLTHEDKIDKTFFKTKQLNNISGYNNNITGSINSQTNHFTSSPSIFKHTSQINFIPCKSTNSDGDLASEQPVKEKPVGAIKVTVNGMVIPVCDGNKTEACYFSIDNGITAKFLNHIEPGDRLYWNGSRAGWNLEPTDDLRFDYLI